MKIAVFSAHLYDRDFLAEANAGRHELQFFEPHLNGETVALARGFDVVCVFVNDCLDRNVIDALAGGGVKLIALRCAGYNNVDLTAAAERNISVVRVPGYSPYAVAEHTMALILALDRRIYRSYNRVREGNFSLDGLLGFDLHEKTIGIIGTGKIGAVLARIAAGYGMQVLASDVVPSEECRSLGVNYVTLSELFEGSDIISLHCPLTADNKYLINAAAIEKMRDGVMLINTSRGGLIDTVAVIDGLKRGKIGYLGLDVYEEEDEIFFEDRSGSIIGDDTFSRLLTFPNVLITGHQAFFTREALRNINATTIESVNRFEENKPLANEIRQSSP